MTVIYFDLFYFSSAHNKRINNSKFFSEKPRSLRQKKEKKEKGE